MACSFCFLHISLAAGHHHPHIWHAGDLVPPPLSKETKSPPAGVGTESTSEAPPTIDWGLFQLLSVGHRPDVDKSVAVASMSFGLHQLHHLFPTVDHARLPLLNSALHQTCQEFGFDIYSGCFGSHQDATLNNSTSPQLWGKSRSFTILDGWVGMVCQVSAVYRELLMTVTPIYALFFTGNADSGIHNQFSIVRFAVVL